MNKKIYRTAQGKMLDMGQLALQNETVRAVGNMGVNARGDVIGDDNRVIKSRGNTVSEHYKKQIKDQREKK